jgi:hypothetical protein
MRWLAVISILFNLVLSGVSHAAAQSTPVITDLGVTAEFGKQMTFRVRVEPLTDVQELLVFISPEAQPTVWQQLLLANSTAEGEITQQVDVRQLPLYPFSRVAYRYQATLKDGSKLTGPSGVFQYDDDRFAWETLESGIFQIHWYGSDSTLGQLIANTAEQGLQAGQAILAVNPPTPVRIYAYTSAKDMQSALHFINQSNIAGHATPELNLILISVPSGPEKKLEVERRIPHEIMHILQYQVMGTNYIRQPVWLVEGMASLTELYPNPEYRGVLGNASKTGSLIPMRSLCNAFPNDMAGAFLSYAQSDSFMRYLYSKYGAPGLRKLIEQYQNGLGCEEGFSAALGTSLDQIEKRWRQEELGVNAGWLLLNNLGPYVSIALIILVPSLLAFFSVAIRRKQVEGKA